MPYIHAMKKLSLFYNENSLFLKAIVVNERCLEIIEKHYSKDQNQLKDLYKETFEQLASLYKQQNLLDKLDSLIKI